MNTLQNTAYPKLSPEQDSVSTGWRTVQELEPGALEASRQKTRHFLGGIAVSAAIEVEAVTSGSANTSTLFDSIQSAARGESNARESIVLNARTNVAEMLHKAGHQTRVELELSEEGKIEQNGKSLVDIQANALLYGQLNEVMNMRTRQEIENVHTFEELLAGDIMDTHDAVVMSLSPEDDYTKRTYGFFADTETCSMQLLKKHSGSKKLTLETALVAGKADVNAKRHDVWAVRELLRSRGSSAELVDVEDSLRHIILVPKENTPHGVEDVVKAYDEVVGGVFYGQSVPSDVSKDYVTHAADCEKRNESFQAIVDEITVQLIRESSSLKSPQDASLRLHELTERALATEALDNSTIDEHVFGSSAAAYIVSARHAAANGDRLEAAQLLEAAIETSVAASCPMFFGATMKDSILNSEHDPLVSIYGEDKYGPLAFRCPKKNCINVRSRNGTFISECQVCGADIPKC